MLAKKVQVADAQPVRLTDQISLGVLADIVPLALGGAALMLFAFFAATPDLGLMITGPLFSLN